MALTERSALVRQLVPPFDPTLAQQLVDEFVSMERRFVQRDWEPAELDGGQFCEILGRILYQQDSGTINLAKSFDDCMTWLHDEKSAHKLPRHQVLHLVRVLRTVYKFRSQRGAVHISPNYTPNHMDAKYVIDATRWCFAEVLRIFWNGDRERVAAIIRELLQFDVPCIGNFDSILIVQRTNLTAEQEVLVLLHYAGDTGFSRSELGKHAQLSAPSVTRAIQALVHPSRRQVVQVPDGRYRLTDLGSIRVREELADTLLQPL